MCIYTCWLCHVIITYCIYVFFGFGFIRNKNKICIGIYRFWIYRVKKEKNKKNIISEIKRKSECEKKSRNVRFLYLNIFWKKIIKCLSSSSYPVWTSHFRSSSSVCATMASCSEVSIFSVLLSYYSKYLMLW